MKQNRPRIIRIIPKNTKKELTKFEKNLTKSQKARISRYYALKNN